MNTETETQELNTTIVSLLFLMVLFIVSFLAVIIVSYDQFLDIAEENSLLSVEQSQKMLLTSEMSELARARTRLTAQLIDIEDVFIQDELNLELEHYASLFASLRQKLLSLPLEDAERAILEAHQPAIVARILPAQREAVELAMEDDKSLKEKARKILYAQVLPGQQELVDSFHTLIKLQQAQIAEHSTTIKSELDSTELMIFRILVGSTILTVILLTVVVIRIQRIQIHLKSMNENLELMVYERTYALEEAREQLERSMDTLDKNVITINIDLNGIIQAASQAFCRISGYRAKTLRGNTLEMIRHPDAAPESFQELSQQLEEGELPQSELKCKARDGTLFWIDVLFDRILDSKGTAIGYTAIMHDITDKKRIETLSVTDALTGLNNRGRLDEALAVEANRASRYGTSLSIVLFDIDYFKKINDTFGHQAGDIVLIQVAEIITTRTREVDISGRWGGEEFMVICPQTGIKGAQELAEELRMAIASYEFGEVGEVTCSLGVAEYSRNEAIEDMLLRVDTALYQSKKEGRNRVSLAK
jgi:diguanylate cyclase (GGDEF)-like protein/PAS domain S-box-containing protein